MESSIEPEAMMAGFLSKMNTQKNEVNRLRDRVAQLEQELRVARSQLSSCKCGARAALSPSSTSTAAAAANTTDGDVIMHIPGGGLDAVPASPLISSASSNSPPIDSQQSVMQIMFGDETKKGKGTAVASSSKGVRSLAAAASPKSPPRRPANSYLSPPTSGSGITRRRSPRRGGASVASSPTITVQAGSLSDAEKALAQLEDTDSTMDANATSKESSPARGGATVKTGGRKRKSGDALVTDDTKEKDAVVTDAEVQERTSKFIKISSPPDARVAVGQQATPVAEAASPLDLQYLIQPSQDAYDQEDEAESKKLSSAKPSSQDEQMESLEYDYNENKPASATQSAALRAKWTALAKPLSIHALDAASRESNNYKELGNNAFKKADFTQALAMYTKSIEIIERVLSEKNADLAPWIELTQKEIDGNGLSDISEELQAIEAAQSLGQGRQLYDIMKQLLRQFSSVYANRATCHAKGHSYFSALTDSQRVISLQPYWFKGYSIHASILVQQKQSAAALPYFEQALSMKNISPEDKAKVQERLTQLKKTIARDARRAAGSQSSGGTSAVPSQQSNAMSLISAAGVKSSPKRATRSHSASASSSTSAGALKGTGTVAQPIRLQQSNSDSYIASRQHSNSPPEIPVHPPSFTPPGSEVQTGFSFTKSTPMPLQQKEMSMEIIQDTPPEERELRERREKEERERRERERIVIKSESAVVHPKSPAPSRTLAAGPLTDASNRMSPLPRDSRAHAPISPMRPRHSTSHNTVHDLTTSPVKSTHSSSKHSSPTRSPARSPRPSPSPTQRQDVNWFTFPIITVEGIRDLVGDEAFADSLDIFGKKRIEAIKIVEGTNGEGPKLVSLVLKKETTRKRGGGLTFPTAASSSSENKENHTHTVSMRFDTVEQRAKEVHCDCHDDSSYQHQVQQYNDNQGPAAAAASGSTPPPSSTPRIRPPCAHVGAVLLVLKKKQEDQEKLKPLDWTNAERAQRSMYVTPARRRTQAELKREAAVRAEMEDLSNSALSELLSRNHQSKTGSKPILIARIIENSILGNLPRCRKCKGSLFYASGQYFCHGGYDPISKRVLQCDFVADRIERTQWQS